MKGKLIPNKQRLHFCWIWLYVMKAVYVFQA